MFTYKAVRTLRQFPFPQNWPWVAPDGLIFTHGTPWFSLLSQKQISFRREQKLDFLASHVLYSGSILKTPTTRRCRSMLPRGQLNRNIPGPGFGLSRFHSTSPSIKLTIVAVIFFQKLTFHLRILSPWHVPRELSE
jgi:hypothetical protein